MKIVLTIEKDGEKLDVAQLSFGREEEDIDAFMSKVYASISEYKKQKVMNLEYLSENVAQALKKL